jgi:hypothetical protein
VTEGTRLQGSDIDPARMLVRVSNSTGGKDRFVPLAPRRSRMHGGPEDVMMDRFSPGAQAWLDHSFAFLTLNYRSSVTFGRAFREQIWGNLGHWEVEDMVAARAWLIDRGIARPNQVFLTGWSYGGYLTLQAMGTQPELWAGGMAGIAVADWAIAHEDTNENLRQNPSVTTSCTCTDAICIRRPYGTTLAQNQFINQLFRVAA